jgi:hypothetical protein
MEKGNKKLVLLILGSLLSMLLLVPLVAGCGGVEMEMETIVEPSGELKHKMTIVIGEDMAQSMNMEDIEGFFEVDGFTMSIEQEGSNILYVYKLEDRWDNYLDIGFFDDQEATINDLKLRVQDNFITRDFYLESAMSANDMSLIEDELMAEFEAAEGEFSELGLGDMGLDGMGLELFASLFSINWVFTMPGDIIESNASHSEGNSAYWDIDIFAMEADQTFSIHSRVINWGIVGGISGVLLLIIILIALIVTRRKREVPVTGVEGDTAFTPVDVTANAKATDKSNNDK